MPAKNKSELMVVTKAEFSRLEKLLETIEPARALIKYDDDTSIKDVVGHRAHWIELFLGWYFDGQAEKEVYFPAKGYKWNQLKAYNAKLRQDQTELDWHQAFSLLRTNHERLVRLIEDLSNSQLYSGPMKGAESKWTPGRFAEAAGPSHYRSATKYIRQCLKNG